MGAMVRAPALLLALALLVPAPGPAAAGDRDGRAPASTGLSPADTVTPEHQAAIDRGLRWLAGMQNVDGSFPTVPSRGGGGNTRSADYQTAVTALGALAFLGAGHGVDRGPYRATVTKAVQWLLRAQDQPSVDFPGYISFRGDDQSKMHGHGFATLALAEAWATAGPTAEGRETIASEFPRRLKRGIQDAVDCIEASQAHVGGWYYVPTRGGTGDHEGSLTVCQVQALHAASVRGFRVSSERIRRAREYMKKSQAGSGAFKYSLSHEDVPRGSDQWALTAAGITALIGLTEYDRREALDAAYRYLDSRGRPRLRRTRYYFYGTFYGVQAYHWAGGEKWERFWMPVRSEILGEQSDAGSWSGEDTAIGLGDVYPTTLCLLMLEVPVGYLSIFQR
jgi:hypothetical protein